MQSSGQECLVKESFPVVSGTVRISISIISHGHAQHVSLLLRDLILLKRNDFEVILTLNVPEAEEILSEDYSFPLRIYRNDVPKGYAANHNAAFKRANGVVFILVNPDIRLSGDPFDSLIDVLGNRAPCICAPLIVNSDGEVEDSARSFPSPFLLMKKLAAKIFNIKLALEKIDIECPGLLRPDWVAGMFVAVPASLYSDLHGMDESYFLYYEDVDFCARACRNGVPTYVVINAVAIHSAQRDSHHNFRYASWHIRSALRFFCSTNFVWILFHRIFGRYRTKIKMRR